MSISQKYLNENQVEQSFSVKDLIKKLEKNCKEVVFAFILGSSKDGVVAPHADLDLAFYLSCEVSLEFYSKVSEIVESVVPDVRVDVGILNNADPVFRYEALKGNLLFTRDQERYLRFYSLTCREYESQMVDYERQRQYRQEVVNAL
ncbi:MAG: nucleotidyltransferase domain-containing protein [Kiritimatiellae bacterium]|jgi:predicted nucleotidyltransferase|nr:nucleotidyltransferase domain-containing protein [Kiritimatiellia bacterium]